MISWLLCDGKLRSINIPIPTPTEAQELVKIDYCGICGTELQKYLNFKDESYWGHEIVGKIRDLNGEFNIPVAIRTSFPCGECPQCTQKQYNQCSKWKRAEINGFSEYITIDKRCIVQLDGGEAKEEFTLTEPLYVAINLVRRINPGQNDKIAILGNGTIGLLCAYYLSLIGCDNVIIFARSMPKCRVKLAKQFGAKTYLYNEIIENLPLADKIINTAAYTTMSDVVQFAKPYTQITFNGISKETMVSLDMIKWHFKNLSIFPSFPHPQTDFSEAIKIIRDNGNVLKQMITNVFSINQLPEAFVTMDVSQKKHIKVIIKMQDN